MSREQLPDLAPVDRSDADRIRKDIGDKLRRYFGPERRKWRSQ